MERLLRSSVLVASVSVFVPGASAGDAPFRAVSFPDSIAPIADGLTPLSVWGRELATDGNRVVVGARSPVFGTVQTFSTGVAEIWEFDDSIATRGWRRVADVLPPEGLVSNDQFGSAVAIEGDLAAVGAPRRTIGSLVNAGEVYLYRRNADGSWSHAQTLTAATPAASEFFGTAVAIEDGSVAVGVPGRANGGGATLFFPDGRGAFGAGVPFNVPGSASADDWGEVIACDGDVVLVGDVQAKVNGIAVGVLASYVLNGEDAPTFEAFLAPPESDIASGALFGHYLDFDGGVLAASSPSFNQNRGAVYLFRRAEGAWSPGPSAYGEASGTRLGRVDVEGQLLAVGAEGSSGTSAPPSAWLYRIDDRELTLLASQQDPDEFSSLGSDVALTGDWWLVRNEPTAGLDDSPRLKGQRIGDVGGDCDGDGVPNAVEVLDEGADDCNGNLVPTTCELATDDCDANGEPDDCQTAPLTAMSTSNEVDAIQFYNASAPLLVFLARVDVPVGANAALAVGGAVSANSQASDVPSYVALFHDPRGRDTPADLTPLGAWSTRFPMSSEPFEVTFDAIPVGKAGALYVAFATAPASPDTAPLFETRDDPYVPLRTFVGAPPSGTFDPDEIGTSTAFHEIDDASLLALNITAFVRFAIEEDSDLDGVPDMCACSADLDGDGDVGPKDLALVLGAWATSSGDLTGDGTTDAADLGVLLGAWGPCS